jgi:hypothetical protein
MPIPKPSLRDLLAAALLLGLAVGGRFAARALNLPNTELLTLSAFLAPLLIRGRLRWAVPLLAVMISDLFLTNSRYMALYTWGAWGVIGLAGMGLHRKSGQVPGNTAKILFTIGAIGVFALVVTRLPAAFGLDGVLRQPGTFGAIVLLAVALGILLRHLMQHRVLTALGFGIGSSVFFFLVTNFGVFVEGLLYPPTLSGLVQCYVAGIPFLEKQLRANLILLPAGAALYDLALLAARSRLAALTDRA